MPTVLDLIYNASKKHGEQIPFQHVCTKQSLSYSQLAEQIDAFAQFLCSQFKQQTPVFVILPSGLDFIVAFFAAQRAGLIPIPHFPPHRHPSKQATYLNQLSEIMQTIDSQAVLTTPNIANQLIQHKITANWRILGIDVLGDTPDQHAKLPPPPAATDIALLQLSSGSTRTPKGIAITQQNLHDNAYYTNSRMKDCETIVSWLPHYHDMGLLVGTMIPIISSRPSFLMNPLTFLTNPVSWLQLIAKNPLVMSGAPNFAYQMCANKITDDDLINLDLSSWSIGFAGAESNQGQTLQEFYQRFAPYGLNEHCFATSYGLAESTCAFSTSKEHSSSSDLAFYFDRDAIHDNKVKATNDKSFNLIANGYPFDNHEAIIVNPKTNEVCRADEVGELWLRGPCIAQGYWNEPKETKETFAAMTSDGQGPYLRTGDLGFIYEGQIFITSRMKDLIIINGRNISPAQIEQTAQQTLSGICTEKTAAFAIEHQEGEKLILCTELKRRAPIDNWQSLFQNLNRDISIAHSCRLHQWIVIPNGNIPVTSSGKIRRALACKKFTEESLPILIAIDNAANITAHQDEKSLAKYLSKQAIAAIPESTFDNSTQGTKE